MEKENDHKHKHIGRKDIQATRRERLAKLLNIANAVAQNEMIQEKLLEGPIDPNEIASIIGNNNFDE